MTTRLLLGSDLAIVPLSAQSPGAAEPVLLIRTGDSDADWHRELDALEGDGSCRWVSGIGSRAAGAAGRFAFQAGGCTVRVDRADADTPWRAGMPRSRAIARLVAQGLA